MRCLHAGIRIAQQIFLDIQKNDYLLTQTLEQLYCSTCAKFLADRFVEGTCPKEGCGYVDARGDQCDQCGSLLNPIELVNPRCKTCGTTPEVRSITGSPPPPIATNV